MRERWGFRILAAALCTAVASSLPAADWPQFRGLERDGVSRESGLTHGWTAAGPRVLWRKPIGDGFSGIAVAAGRLYTMFADDQNELAAAFDRATGAELWRAVVGGRFTDEFGDGPRSTPTIDGERLYVLGSKGRLVALEAATGKVVWQVELTERFGSHVPRWGYATSPLVDGDRLVLEVGAGAGRRIAALDKRTGETQWTALDGEAGYSSPIVAKLGGVRQYVFASGQQIVGIAQDGKLLWTAAWEPGAIAMPLYVPPDRVFVSSSDDVGSMLLRVTAAGDTLAAERVWTSRNMKNTFNASVVVGDRIYGFDNATLRCIAVDSGEPCWAKRGYGKGSLIAADGLLIALGDQGQLVLATATPEEYKERGTLQVLNDKSWTAPTLADGRLFLRNQKEIVCIDLKS